MEYSTLDQLLDTAQDELAKLDPRRVHDILRKNGYRPSFMIIPSSEMQESFRQICLSLRSVGPNLKFLVESPSSAECSEEESCVPSVRKVAETILDITNISFSKHHLKSCLSVLALGNIELSLSIAHIDSIIKRYGGQPTQISFLDLKKDTGIEHYALLYFRTLAEAKFIYAKLAKDEENGRLGAILHRIPGSQHDSYVRWLNYRVLDPDFNWTAVILRSLPQNFSTEHLRIKLGGEFIFHAETPRFVNNYLCTILVLRRIEDAFIMIKKFKRSKFPGLIDIHPYSSIFKKPKNYVTTFGLDVVSKRLRQPVEVEPPVKIFKPNDTGSESDFQELELKTTGGSMEDGEIIDKEEIVIEQEYQLYEFPGVYWMKGMTELSHKGIKVKTLVEKDSR
ncbi:unnamed protein product [Blepharisma stoltei]|uniref:Uncharacterized protein n=1 Tax=Blepharisma stoltei TaxID=1481888 RepID=A0AAU9KGL9_9CILI|nr:unnamed protein product [Blepharisma stoltei]